MAEERTTLERTELARCQEELPSRTLRTESVADLRVHMSGQHDPISGKYIFDLPNRSDDDYSDNYAFDEERANREYDYIAERKERKDMMDESDNEEGGTPSEQQDVRFKYLPENYKVSSNLDFLQPGVAKNLTLDPRHYIHTLRRIQQYMIPLVLNEFTFVVVGPQGLGKTTGYMLPLVNKLVELREIENRGRRGPLAIVVTHTENKIRHIRELCNRYSHGTF
ncbi:unnamed protein product [Nippostrongylus brasiliensis]|uniref:DEAD domain-containing protein n=1 Tax=Nippostrongylus brasiliensis TaxID=27835 RepID=A0A0N4YKQ1_NIPBR|nr:unnamed protein product [Nippostrongylus brasiliensis]